MEDDLVSQIAGILSDITTWPKDEKQLQQWTQDRLAVAGIDFRREVKSGSGYVDFVIGRTAIELKVRGSLLKVTRQVIRYLEDDRFDMGIIVSTKPFQGGLDLGQLSKPIHVIELWRQFIG